MLSSRAQNERVETITLNVWLEAVWQDPLLVWDASQAKVSRLHLPAGTIWLPELVFIGMYVLCELSQQASIPRDKQLSV